MRTTERIWKILLPNRFVSKSKKPMEHGDWGSDCKKNCNAFNERSFFLHPFQKRWWLQWVVTLWASSTRDIHAKFTPLYFGYPEKISYLRNSFFKYFWNRGAFVLQQPVFQEHRWQEQLFTWRVWRNNELWVAFGCLVWIIRRLRVEMKYFLTKFVADNKTKRCDVQCWFNYWISIDKYLSEGRFPFRRPHQFTQSWHRVNRKKTWTLHLRRTMWIPHGKKCKCF